MLGLLSLGFLAIGDIAGAGIGCVCLLLTGILGLLAIVFGGMGLSRKRPHRGRAGVGLACGCLGLLVLPGALVATLLPMLSQSRELVKRAVCQSQIKGVGAAIKQYETMRGRAPRSLNDLVKEGLVTPGHLVCPSSTSGRPCDYFYCRPGRTTSPDAMMVCGLPGSHRGEGRSVFYCDGRVAFLEESDFLAELAEPRNADFATALAAGP